MCQSPDTRVLVVEDDARLRDLLIEMLAAYGLTQVTGVSSVRDATSAIRVCQPDVILLDLWLPDSRGCTTIHRLKAMTKWAAIVVLTGMPETWLRQDCIDAGAYAFLRKGEVTLSTVIETLLMGAETYAIGRRILQHAS